MQFTPGYRVGRSRDLRYADASDSDRVRQLSFGGDIGPDRATAVESATPVVRPKSSLRGDSVSSTAQPKSSTPTTTDSDTLEQIRGLLGELGTQIGDSVVNRLLANKMIASSEGSPLATNTLLLGPSSLTPDLFQLSVVVKTDSNEPAAYRGDGTGKLSVQEWIDAMDTYLRKRGGPTVDQVDEILSHLLGQAKNILKEGLKSNSDRTAHPEVIYDA